MCYTVPNRECSRNDCRNDTFDRSLCVCRKYLCVTFVESNKGKSKLYQNNPCVPRTRRSKRTTAPFALRVTSGTLGTWYADLLYKRGNTGNIGNR